MKKCVKTHLVYVKIKIKIHTNYTKVCKYIYIDKIFLKMLIRNFWYDKESAEGSNWVSQGGESESGQMVLKKVKWTYFDAYLCQTMWNHAKKSMKRLKRPNSLFLQGEVSSAVLKTWKTGETKTWITQNFKYYTVSRVPPLKSWRPELSENVVVFGCKTFQRGVIAAQSQQTLEFLATILICGVWRWISVLSLGFCRLWFNARRCKIIFHSNHHHHHNYPYNHYREHPIRTKSKSSKSIASSPRRVIKIILFVW